jgi:ankyrin repeat protein
MRAQTPLYYASREGHLPIVKALVDGGAGIRAANNHGRLPIHLAVRRRQPAVAKCLLKQLYATSFEQDGRLPIHALLEDLIFDDIPTTGFHHFALHFPSGICPISMKWMVY